MGPVLHYAYAARMFVVCSCFFLCLCVWGVVIGIVGYGVGCRK